MLAQHRLGSVALPRPPAALVGAADMLNEALEHCLQVIERDRQQRGADEWPHQLREHVGKSRAFLGEHFSWSGRRYGDVAG